MEIVQSMLTENPCYKNKMEIQVKGLMLHSVGCPQPSADVFIKQFNNAGKEVCVHAFIDGNTGVVHQTLPWNYKAWHAGGSANSTYIGVEMCEPANLDYKGGNPFACDDRDKAMEVVKRTYDAAVELFAHLCKEFNLDPLGEDVIISHKEGGAKPQDRKHPFASAHIDPDHLWSGLQSGYTMDGFRHDVRLAMNQEQGQPEQASEPEQPEQASESEQPEQTSEPKPSYQSPLRAGDIVKVTEDAVYYNGRSVTPFVFNEEWIVESVEGDRVVLGQSVSETYNIHSPINDKYLDYVSRPLPMEITEKGMAFIKEFEGCKLEAYQCAAGAWTIGYGHTAGVKEGDTLSSEKEASELFEEDLKEYTGYVNTYMANGTIGFPLTQNQFDALTSFCYNRGSGRLKDLVTGKSAEEVAEDLLSSPYTTVKDVVNSGLLRRRKEEREMFLS